MTIGNKKMYSFYKEQIADRMKTVCARIKRVNHQIDHYKSVLEANKDWIANYSNITFKDIILITNPDKIKCSAIAPVGEYKLTGVKLIAYVRSFNRALKIKIELQRELDKLRIPYTIYSKFFELYDLYVSEAILDGKIHYIPSIGEIKIKEKKRYFVENEVYNTKVPDWGETNKLLITIAKTYFPDVYKVYIEDKHKLEYLKKELAPHLYNKQTNPTGYKYIVYHTSTYSYWWIWARRNTRMPNYKYYTFVPTAYNNVCINGRMINDNELKRIVTVDQVKDLALGNQDKMRLYLELDKHRKEKYRNVI